MINTALVRPIHCATPHASRQFTSAVEPRSSVKSLIPLYMTPTAPARDPAGRAIATFLLSLTGSKNALAARVPWNADHRRGDHLKITATATLGDAR